MSDATLSRGGWVNSFDLDNVLSRKISDRSLIRKYMACFNEKFPSKRASEREFKKWAKEDLLKECKNGVPMSLDDAKKVANVL